MNTRDRLTQMRESERRNQEYLRKWQEASVKAKPLIEAAARAAAGIDEKKAARLEGVIQGYTLIVTEGGEKHA